MNSTELSQKVARLKKLLTVFGNLSFDCGAWDEEGDSTDGYLKVAADTREAEVAIVNFVLEMCDVPRS